MTEEILNKRLSEIPKDKLIELAEKEVRDLCETGGKSIHLRIPPSEYDTDMILCELIKRFKKQP